MKAVMPKLDFRGQGSMVFLMQLGGEHRMEALVENKLGMTVKEVEELFRIIGEEVMNILVKAHNLEEEGELRVIIQ